MRILVLSVLLFVGFSVLNISWGFFTLTTCLGTMSNNIIDFLNITPKTNT